MSDFLLSVIVPCYNEAENIRLLVDQLQKALEPMQYEVIFVNDGSTDHTGQMIKLEMATNNKIGYITFSRNFGHQAAIKAGIDHAKGNCIVTMDADMQHPPDMIKEMIRLWEDGYEIVTAVRKNTEQLGWFKKITSRLFYWLLSKLSDHKVVFDGADFRLFDKKVAQVIRNMAEQDLYLRGIFSWVGFKQTTIDYQEGTRAFGKTKYSTKKMLQLALNGITSFSIKPLRLSLLVGITFALLAFAYGVYAIVVMALGHAVSGWTSIIASGLFLSGVQLTILGIMGEYLGKMYMAHKQRPNYIIATASPGIERKTKTNVSLKKERIPMD